MIEIALEGRPFIKLCDLLSLAQLCPNAGVAKHIIASGVVKVDGKIELRKRAKIVAKQIVGYQGKEVKVI